MLITAVLKYEVWIGPHCARHSTRNKRQLLPPLGQRNQKGNRLKKEENKVKVRNSKNIVEKNPKTSQPPKMLTLKSAGKQKGEQRIKERIWSTTVSVLTLNWENPQMNSPGVWNTCCHHFHRQPRRAEPPASSLWPLQALPDCGERKRAQNKQFHICWSLLGRSLLLHCEVNLYHRGAPSNLEIFV